MKLETAMYTQIIIATWILYECFLYYNRRTRLVQVYRQAVQHAVQTNKPLLVLGNSPCLNKQIQQVDHEEISVDFTGDELDTFMKGLDLDTYVVFERGVFTEHVNFDNVERMLSMKPTCDIYLHHVQPYSLLAWTFQIDITKAKVNIPRRVFIFYPPNFRFIYVLDNPVSKYIDYIITVAGLMGALSVLYTRFCSNSIM